MTDMEDKLLERNVELKNQIMALQQQVTKLESRLDWYERILKRHGLDPVTGEKYGNNE